jgi:hypothetical protein
VKPAQYSPLLQMLQQVPVAASDFTVDETGGRPFGFSRDDLLTLACEGLPHLCVDGRRWFRWGDLHYLGVRLGTARPYLLNVTLWARALTELSAHERTMIEVDYVPQLGREHGGHVAGRVALPDGPKQLTLRSGVVASTARVFQRGRPDPVAPALRTLLTSFEHLQLYVIPESLRTHGVALAGLGLCDCESAARLLVDAAAREGFEARLAYGLLVSFPFSTPHGWAEVCVEGRWTAIDPLTANVIRDFGPEQSQAVGTYACLGAILMRVDTEPVALVSVDGRSVEATYPTRRAQSVSPRCARGAPSR